MRSREEETKMNLKFSAKVTEDYSITTRNREVRKRKAFRDVYFKIFFFGSNEFSNVIIERIWSSS